MWLYLWRLWWVELRTRGNTLGADIPTIKLTHHILENVSDASNTFLKGNDLIWHLWDLFDTIINKVPRVLGFCHGVWKGNVIEVSIQVSLNWIPKEGLSTWLSLARLWWSCKKFRYKIKSWGILGYKKFFYDKKEICYTKYENNNFWKGF